MARLPEFGLYADGESDQRAIQNLVEDTIELHEDLQTTNDEELGPIPQRQKIGLSRLIVTSEMKKSPDVEDKPNYIPFVKLIEALTLDVPRRYGDPTLTVELAEHFNQVIGGDLPDSVLLSHLDLPMRNELKHLTEAEREKSSSLDSHVKSSYNRALFNFRRARQKTVGDVREMSPEKASGLRLSGGHAYDFLQLAFKPKPQTEA